MVLRLRWGDLHRSRTFLGLRSDDAGGADEPTPGEFPGQSLQGDVRWSGQQWLRWVAALGGRSKADRRDRNAEHREPEDEKAGEAAG